jgi:hypothetical protein
MGLWLLGSAFGRRHIKQLVREKLTHNSELVLAPFEVELSPWQDFPHLTASLHPLLLTDTTAGQPAPVLRIGRADLRLALADLLRGRVRVSRLTVTDVNFDERIDSLGHRWGLRGKREKGTGRAPGLYLKLDSLIVNNFRMTTRNDFAHSAFGASVRQARLTATLRRGTLRVSGSLTGQLDQLRNRGGTLFRNEPVRAWVNYRYAFEQHQGKFWNTKATLNGDTVRVSGTHTVPTNHPVGTMMNLRFEGTQPLTEVLGAALPPTLKPYLTGARSPSKAYIRYTIQGYSGPRISPRNVLRFGLDGASLVWPDSLRRIRRWDLRGTLDNGPGHKPESTVLTLQRCRIYSSAGQLNLALTLRDFTRPFINGRLRGSTELPDLAAAASPTLWRARGGTADLDVRLRGLLPTPAERRTRLLPRKSLSVRGVVTLRNAALVMLDRQAYLSGLNVRVGLQDSIWQLSNASGVLDGMRFQAAATTTNLFDYLTGQHPTTQISGSFAVDVLRVARLKQLLRPIPRVRPALARRRPRRPRSSPAELAATLARSVIPPGLHLNVGLRCQRLVLATDTLSNLAVTVRHDGRQVQLQQLTGRVWGGEVRGQLSWPTDTLNPVALINYQLNVGFADLSYRQLMARLMRPARRPAKAPASPALSELLLAANGQLTCTINTVHLPDGERLRHLRMQLNKSGSTMRMPSLRFTAPQGGQGQASATAQVADRHLVAAEADVNLSYANLDVQKLLQMIASLTAKPDSLLTARTVARATARTAARATRRARREQENRALLADGILRAVLHVQAEQVHYGALRGHSFRLVSHLRDGEARLDDCSLDALQGRITLRGRLLTNAGRYHHPLRVQARLENIQLPDLFAAATAMRLKVLGGENIRGSLRCAADLRTDLDSTFLPALEHTQGYLKADIRDLELLDVEALEQGLKFMKEERTRHLFFEPVSTVFVLNQGQLLIPKLPLNSNLTNLELSGSYGFADGSADLYVGFKPLQALFGNNEKRIERIQNGEPLTNPKGKLTYVGLTRPGPGAHYKVHLFQKDEQREQQARLREQYRQLLLTQRLDTTLQFR